VELLVDVARSYRLPSSRLSLLAAAAGQLPEATGRQLRQEIREQIARLSPASQRLDILLALADGAPGEERRQLLAEAVDHWANESEAHERAFGLGKLLPVLIDERPEAVPDYLANVTGASQAKTLLMQAAQRLPATMLPPLVSLTWRLGSVYDQVAVLALLIPRLPDEALHAVLLQLQQRTHEAHLLELLELLTPRWRTMCQEAGTDPFTEMAQTLAAAAHAGSYGFFTAIQALLPLLAVEAPAALEPLVRALEEEVV
jgi:hypothetical protein